MLGAPAGPRVQLARGRGSGPIRWRGQTGFGPSGGPDRTTGGFYARGSGVVEGLMSRCRLVKDGCCMGWFLWLAWGYGTGRGRLSRD